MASPGRPQTRIPDRYRCTLGLEIDVLLSRAIEVANLYAGHQQPRSCIAAILTSPSVAVGICFQASLDKTTGCANGCLWLFLLMEARSGEWATCLRSWCRALFAGPIGGLSEIEFLAFGWVWAVLGTTTFDSIMLKVVGPLEAPHVLLFSWVSGPVVSRPWGPPLPLLVAGFWYLWPPRGPGV